MPSDQNPTYAGPWRSGSLRIGQVLADRYRIVTLLGHGGMGEVYEAEDTVLSLAVALKTIRGQVDQNAVRRFQREVILARHVAHLNVCRVFDFGKDDAAGAFYTMELLRGETLAQILQKRKPLPLAEARTITTQVASALEAAHAHGIVHRDLKPGNIFIAEQNRVVVTDFGLARAAIDSAAIAGQDTQSNFIAGTPAYMSPEQMTGGEQSASVDLYALGVVMYEMTTGRLPWSEASPAERLTGTPASPRVEPGWDAATMRCLEPTAARRFRSARDLLLALSGGKPVRSQARWWAVAAGAVVLLSLTAWLWTSRSAWTPRPEAEAWYRLGLVALHDGDYNSAAKQLQMAVDADTNFAMAHARLAEAWAEQDYADRARQSMLQAAAIATQYPVADRTDAMRLLAIHMTVARDLPNAVLRYGEIAETKRDSDSLYDYARALERNSDIAPAVAKYREAVKLQDTYAAAWARLGSLLGRQAVWPDAYTAFDKAETVYRAAGNLTGLSETRIRRAVALTAQGRAEEASQTLDQALKLVEATGFESQRIRILLRRGVLARLREENDQAERFVSEALRLAEENRMEQYSLEGLMDLGSVYLQKRDLPAAERHFATALRIARSQGSRLHEARATVLIASVRSQQGQLEDARAGAEKALKVFRAAGYQSETRSTLTLLAQIRSQSGDAAGALAAFEEQLKLTPASNARALAATHLRIGIALHRLDRCQEALNHLEVALSSPESVTRAYAAINKAEILIQTGASAEARRLLNDEKLMAELSGVVALRAQAALARAALQEGHFSEAVGDAERAMAGVGDSDPVLRLELRTVMAEALSRSGSDTRAWQICDEITRERSDVQAYGFALLACAEVDLRAKRPDPARRRAHEAARMFATLVRPEAQWRACLTERSLMRQEEAAAKSFECENIRKSVADKWGPDLWARYIARPDIRDRMAHPERMTVAKQ